MGIKYCVPIKYCMPIYGHQILCALLGGVHLYRVFLVGFFVLPRFGMANARLNQ